MTTTEIILVVLLVLTLVILLYLIFKKSPPASTADLETRIRNQQELISKLEALRFEISKELETTNLKTKSAFKDELNTFKDTITSKVSENMTSVNEKVEKRLSDGFHATDALFKSITERLTIIDSSQKNVEKLSLSVTELTRLLSDKKLRGMFGEGQLYQILDNVFGENNKTLYEKQKKLSNGSLVDAVIYGPENMGLIAVDSKFPLENYLLMNNDKASADDRNQASKDFKGNIKKHIDDISSKYIIKGETANQAILFLPAEAIFAELHAKYEDLIAYGQSKHVWIASPTTFVYMLTMIMVISSDIAKEKNVERMLSEIDKLHDDFRLFFERWENVKKAFKSAHKHIEELEKPMSRLNKKVYRIEKTQFDDFDEEN